MNHLFVILFSLILLVGYGKKEASAEKAATEKFAASKPDAVLWEFRTGGAVMSSPVIGANGTVYVGSNDNKVYALAGKTGIKKWEFETEGDVRSPVIGADGVVYVGSDDGTIYALKTDSKGPAKSLWPMRGQNAQHTGRAPKK